ncbi:MAG: hypothetical protein AAB683_00485 [Patescibacteria group bacterium]
MKIYSRGVGIFYTKLKTLKKDREMYLIGCNGGRKCKEIIAFPNNFHDIGILANKVSKRGIVNPYWVYLATDYSSVFGQVLQIDTENQIIDIVFLPKTMSDQIPFQDGLPNTIICTAGYAQLINFRNDSLLAFLQSGIIMPCKNSFVFNAPLVNDQFIVSWSSFVRTRILSLFEKLSTYIDFVRRENGMEPEEYLPPDIAYEYRVSVVSLK